MENCEHREVNKFMIFNRFLEFNRKRDVIHSQQGIMNYLVPVNGNWVESLKKCQIQIKNLISEACVYVRIATYVNKKLDNSTFKWDNFTINQIKVVYTFHNLSVRDTPSSLKTVDKNKSFVSLEDSFRFRKLLKLFLVHVSHCIITSNLIYRLY